MCPRGQKCSQGLHLCFLARFVCSPYNRLKNLSAAVNATRSATRILLKERGLQTKVNFFAQKFSYIGPMLNKLMQLKCITKGGQGGGGAEPPAVGRFL